MHRYTRSVRQKSQPASSTLNVVEIQSDCFSKKSQQTAHRGRMKTWPFVRCGPSTHESAKQSEIIHPSGEFFPRLIERLGMKFSAVPFSKPQRCPPFPIAEIDQESWNDSAGWL
jgi:hypothetical protein